MEQLPLDVENILQRIKLEIHRQEHGEDPQKMVAHDAVGPAGYIPRINATREDLQLRRSYSIAEFMQFHDSQFIDNTFRTVLGRLGDDHYLNELRSGRLSRIEILGRVRYAPEGRRRGITVAGLLPMFALHSSFKVPLLGYLLESIYHLLRLPQIARKQRMLEERLAVAERDLAVEINHSIDQLEQAINSASGRH